MQKVTIVKLKKLRISNYNNNNTDPSDRNKRNEQEEDYFEWNKRKVNGKSNSLTCIIIKILYKMSEYIKCYGKS